jgi:hypothetical protein
MSADFATNVSLGSLDLGKWPVRHGDAQQAPFDHRLLTILPAERHR